MTEIGGITPKTMPPVGCSTRSAGFILKMGEGVVTTAAPFLLAVMVRKFGGRVHRRTFAECFPMVLPRPCASDQLVRFACPCIAERENKFVPFYLMPSCGGRTSLGQGQYFFHALTIQAYCRVRAGLWSQQSQLAFTAAHCLRRSCCCNRSHLEVWVG